jgi:hypothetical protein
VEEIITYAQGNKFQVQLNVCEGGKYIRVAKNNIA